MYLERDAQAIMLQGINKVADLVAATMGPGGKTISITNVNANYLTKDGVTVAQKVQLDDKFQQNGADFVVEAAQRALKDAGDGTTTTTVMARAMMLEGYQRLSLKKLNTHSIAKHMKEFMEKVIIDLETQAINGLDITTEVGLKYLTAVALISSNGDQQMSDMVIEAISAVGSEPSAITVRENYTLDTDQLKIVDGMVLKSRIDPSILGPYRRRLITPVKDEGKVAIVVFNAVDKEISYTKTIQTLLNQIYDQGHGIVCVGREFAENFKAAVRRDSERFQIAFIEPKLHGNKFVQMAEDLRILTNGSNVAVSDEEGYVSIGYCDSVDVYSDMMQLINPINTNTQVHLEHFNRVKQMLNEATDAVNIAMIKERLANLGRGTALISVTGSSEQEVIERYARYDDCVRAVCTAIKTGVIRGGGSSFLSAAYGLQEERIDPLDQERKLARDLIEAALITPFNTITKNSLGYNPKINGRELKDNIDLCVDAWTGEMVYAFDKGIIDPLGVQTTALRAAVNATALFLNVGGTFVHRAQGF